MKLTDKILSKVKELSNIVDAHEYEVLTDDTASLSNSSQLIRFKNGDEYYLRYSSKINDEIVSRENERYITYKMAILGLTPPTYFLSNNRKLSKKVVSSSSKHDDLSDQLKLLYEFRALMIPELEFSDKKCSNYINKYAKIINDPEYTNPIVNQYKSIENLLRKCSPAGLYLCHFDTVKGNLVYDGDKPYLIDFEYSGYYYIEFDLASMIIDRDIDTIDGLFTMVGKYVKKIDEVDVSLILVSTLMVCQLWFLWGIAYYKSNHDEKFLNESTTYRDKYSKYLSIYMMATHDKRFESVADYMDLLIVKYENNNEKDQVISQ